ncbi:hypothetical protein [Rothia terrae]|uniref:Uncharacterized protein n=1 Tax=Rothia terrae TaxID=396015 RepID=A0A7H2BDJ4_9MICC|nr:hypothetical protein [Rothia terrae]QNV37740.1 hypothetical protein IDM49_11215 [Rothia terrae]
MLAGRWTLDAGRWTLDAGRWTLDAGRWTLDAGRWTLDAGRWTLDAGRWTLDAGRWTRWTLDAGRWTLDAGRWTLDAGRWTLDAGRWTLDAGRWTLDAGRWTLDAGRWTLDAGRWTLDASLCPSCRHCFVCLGIAYLAAACPVLPRRHNAATIPSRPAVNLHRRSTLKSPCRGILPPQPLPLRPAVFSSVARDALALGMHRCSSSLKTLRNLAGYFKLPQRVGVQTINNGSKELRSKNVCVLLRGYAEPR